MSAPQPLAVGKRGRDDAPLHGSCAARVLVLVDIAELSGEKSSNGIGASSGAALFVDGLRLSVLRVLTRLCASCPQESWVEWATRFFDSRRCGVGKTPAELKARLRSRQAAQGTRGFTRLTQASFRAFGDACLAVACGVHGDPLARDREVALRRWAHGRNQRRHAWTSQSYGGSGEAQPRLGEPRLFSESSAVPASNSQHRSGVGTGGSLEDGPRLMYDGHDMSRHEVVVRSLLEVLQEFGEAGQGERATSSSIAGATSGDGTRKPQQLILLHSALPDTDDDAERFAFRGNFTTEAATHDDKSPDEKAASLMDLLNAHLGKAVLRAGSRGVSFLWQDGARSSATEHSGDGGSGLVRRGGCLRRCLAAACGGGVLQWGRVVGSTGMLPPSATLDRCFQHVGRGTGLEGDRLRRNGAALAVALNRGGAVDAHLIASPLSDSGHCVEPGRSSGVVDMSLPGAVGAASHSTPWRLIGTVPIGEVWPRSLLGQGWGATVVLQAHYGFDKELWREFLGQLRAGELAAAIALPRRIFQHDALPDSGDGAGPGRSFDELTVALLMPVSSECAVGWSVGGNEPTPPCEQGARGKARQSSQPAAPAPRALDSMDLVTSAEDRSVLGVASQSVQPVLGVDDGPMRAGLTLKMRRGEVGLAMQQASIARRRRRQARTVPGEGAHGIKRLGSSIAGAREQGGGSGGQSALLSPQDSGSVCFTAEGTSGDGAAYNVGQWRLEMSSETSHGSASPRGCRLFEAAAGGAEDDDRASSAGSSSVPRRALHQALEDVSSHSSLIGPDADSSSTPGSKGSVGWSAGVTTHQLREEGFANPRSRRQSQVIFTTADEETEAAAFPEVVGGGANELPLSFMSEPALACLPGARLPVEVVELAENCARSNESAAASAAATAGDVCGGVDVAPTNTQTSASRSVGARLKFIDAVRSMEKTRQAPAPGPSELTRSSLAEREIPPLSGDIEQMPEEQVGPEAITGDGGSSSVEDLASAKGVESVVSDSDPARGFEHRISEGVSGLLRQCRDVVEGGQRSPVEFVVRTVPEAVRELADGVQPSDGTASAASDRNARAAQVLAAVVSGLTCTPEELSAKYRAKRVAGPAAIGAGVVSAVATPAVQKIRDYQLQALLLCQLHALAMDLPEVPESVAAFSALAASAGQNADGGGRSSKGKKGKGKGKGKGKKRGRKGGGQDDDSGAARPSDPLPDCRRARLVDFLQPISTMLDARTVTRAPSPDDGGAVDGGGGGNGGSQSRAYDGTLADFMSLALVEHFRLPLPRTLVSLFDDFEYHPPDALAAALAGTLSGGGDAAAGRDGKSGTNMDLEARPGKDTKKEETAMAGIAVGTDHAGTNSRVASTAGILLSDRTPMSHNHFKFKMSGVLNGFPKVNIKAHAASGGLRTSVLGGVPSNGQGLGAYAGNGGEESGGWRTTGGGGGASGRGARSRATRDSKTGPGLAPSQAPRAAIAEPATVIRQSPRLNRKRPGGATRLRDKSPDAHASVSGGKRSAALARSTSTAPADSQPRKRQVVARSGGVPRAPAGVLVGETPQKGRGKGAAARTSGRGDGASRAPLEKPAVGPASPAGAMTRRRAMDSASPEGVSLGGARGVPSPPSWRAASSAASRLFVAESPGVSVCSARSRRSMLAASDLCGQGDGISRQLAAESASPVRQRRSVVPDTPA